MEFKPINTQEELDARIGDRLKREQETVSRRFEQQLTDKDNEIAKFKTDIESLNQQLKEANDKAAGIPELESKIKTYERASVKSRVARELGIPDAIADRLTGETEEDLRKDGETLKKFISAFQPVAPLASPETKEQNAREKALAKLLKDMKGEE